MTHSVQAMVWPVVSLPARKKMKYSCTCNWITSLTQSFDSAVCLMPKRKEVEITGICCQEAVELRAAQWDQTDSSA